MHTPIKFYEFICDRQKWDTSFQAFFKALPGPSVFHFEGDSNDSCRVVVTLLHGNEPSGLKALHKLLCNKFRPAIATKFIVASVTAAKTEPQFTHRMLPDTRDLNRCFSEPFDDVPGKLAESIIRLISSWQADWVIDVHNTSGSGPAFSVATVNTSYHQALASYFCQRQIVTDIRLGSLMECEFGCPVVTIEAGGAQDEHADNTAYAGLYALLNAADIQAQHEMEILHHPRRLEVANGVSLGYASFPDPSYDVCMLQDIEKLNFGVTPAGTILGYATEEGFAALTLDNRSSLAPYFVYNQGQIITAQALKLFMVTTRSDIARTDCLFYFVESK